MSISSISSMSGNTYSSMESSDEITQLEKQKSVLEKELQKVNQSKEDAKTKEQKVKQLQLQIQQLEAQIQQKKSERNGQNGNRTAAAPAVGDTAGSGKDSSRESSNNKIDISI